MGYELLEELMNKYVDVDHQADAYGRFLGSYLQDLDCVFLYCKQVLQILMAVASLF